HAEKICTRHGQRTRARAGAQKQSTVFSLSALEVHLPVRAVDRLDPRAIVGGHALLLPKFLWAEIERFRGRPFGKKFLRQRRTLIGSVRLIADHADRLIVAALTETQHKLRGRLARADDDDHAASRVRTSI